MIYKNLPKKFNPRFEIVSCYVEHNGKILLLHRHGHKSEGNRWGVPGGKIDGGESELGAMVRVKLDKREPVKISTYEHKDYRWVSPGNALKLNLVRELDRCIKMFYEV